MPLAVVRPRERLGDRPAAGPLPVEAELGAQPVEPAEDTASRVAELEGADDRGQGELALADERLRVDREPRLPLRGENVLRVEVLVDEHLLPLRLRKPVERVERRVEEPPLETGLALPLLREIRAPPRRLVGERAERLACVPPESREEPDQDVEGGVGAGLVELRPGLAALEQQRVALRVFRQEPDGAVSVPGPECAGLVLGLAVRMDQLEHGRRPVLEVGPDGVACGARLVGLAEPQAPFLATVCC